MLLISSLLNAFSSFPLECKPKYKNDPDDLVHETQVESSEKPFRNREIDHCIEQRTVQQQGDPDLFLARPRKQQFEHDPHDQRVFFRRKGYDSIEYENDYEGAGSSYILFRSGQFKSVDNLGTFDPKDARFYFQAVGDKFRTIRDALPEETGETPLLSIPKNLPRP